MTTCGFTSGVSTKNSTERSPELHPHANWTNNTINPGSNDWTYEIVEELTKKKIPESDRHDFKRELPSADTLTKITCAFANSNGGFIVLGIKDGSLAIKGMERDPEISHKFGQKIKANPTIYFEPPKYVEIPASEKVITIFHIPKSPEGPHIPEQEDKRTFWKRTNAGNKQMTHEEVRVAFQRLEERREKIKLLYLELIHLKEIINDIIVPDDDLSEYYSLSTLDYNVLNSLLVELYVFFMDDNELISMLYELRRGVNMMNNESKIFLAQMAAPFDPHALYSKTDYIKKHNKLTLQRHLA